MRICHGGAEALEPLTHGGCGCGCCIDDSSEYYTADQIINAIGIDADYDAADARLTLHILTLGGQPSRTQLVLDSIAAVEARVDALELAGGEGVSSDEIARLDARIDSIELAGGEGVSSDEIARLDARIDGIELVTDVDAQVMTLSIEKE